MSHRPGHDGIAEILGSGQFPGVSIRQPIRRATLRDANGREARVLYAGGEDSGSIERDMIHHAEADGIDLATAKLVDVAVEDGNRGLGHNGRKPKDVRKRVRPRKPDFVGIPVSGEDGS